MKIFLLDVNKEMTDAWYTQFETVDSDIDTIYIVNDEFDNFMRNYPNVGAIVSPANAFGLMTGGYDKAIVNHFGYQLMQDVQTRIMKKWGGEQPVGTSISVPIVNHLVTEDGYTRYPILIHTPTMRIPEPIHDARIVYQCMRTSLIEARRNGVKSIVIPAFGGCTGKVPCYQIAVMMKLAYDQLTHVPEAISWEYAHSVADPLNCATKM